MTVTENKPIYRFGLIALLVLGAYGCILSHGFVWDDYDIIVNNPMLASLGNIPRFFLTEDKVNAATGFYRPVTYISFALDRAIWGGNPLGFNLTNLLLQLLVALSFFAVVREMFRQERLALFAAALFALHPLAVETVNFHAGGRNTLLSAFFALMSLYFYLKQRRGWSVAFFALAIFSKEFALLLPMVFLFYDLRIRRIKADFGRYLPYLVALVCYLTLRSFAVAKANALGGFRFSSQLWLTPYLVVRYLINMIFPFRLKVMYDEQTSMTVCVICLLLVLLMAGAILLFKKREQDELTLSGFWFLLFLIPVINIVPLVSNTLIADRYAYFSLMGFSLALAWLLCRFSAQIGSACAAVICLAFIPVDVIQSGVWKDEVTLFSRMAKDAPQMSIGPHNLAMYYYQRGDMAHTQELLLEAARRGDMRPQSLVGAASIFVEAGQPAQAEPLLLKALQMDPGNPETYLMLQTVAQQRGNGAQAQSYLEQAQRAIPSLGEEMAKEAAAFNLEGEKYIAEGKYVNAGNMLRRALKLKPDSVPVLVNLGKVRLEQGDLEGAARHLNQALALDGSDAAARQLLTKLYERQGKAQGAGQSKKAGR